jgi:CheY-like chemotaxis protein
LWPVFIDPAQVDQILANLCVNARDAISDTGKVTIETENRLLDEAYCAANPGFVPGAYVQLSVSDDGCGMTQETLSHLFEPFFTTKRPGEGTGLGLSTVYGIVRQNEGFVNVYSEPGKGTTVKIYLPRHTGAEAKGVEEEAAPAKAQGELVLLVEDEAAMLKVSRRLLENLGYRVLTADSPAEAIRLAEKTPEPVDVLITDVVMPEMNGRELAQRVQALHRNIRCLFMSGYTANVIARQGVLQPGVHFLQKPFNRAQLAAKLREVLGRGTTREE